MIRYVRLGDLPAKKHIQHRRPDGELYTEQLFSTRGFDGPLSTLYHIHKPTEISAWEDLGSAKVELLEDEALRHRHLRTDRMTPHGNLVSGRIPLMGNQDLTWHQVLTAAPFEGWFKNAEADEILFIHDGSGTLETMFGDVEVRPGDYLVIPRGTIWRLDFGVEQVRAIVLESRGPVTTPRRYRNEYGQMLEHAPFTERDFRPPHALRTYDEAGEFEVVIQARGRRTRCIHPRHPFDVAGWDGFVYPVAFSIHDFQPITGKLHMPPPIHQTFAAHNFVVCSFCPRMLDYHPDAIVVPYVHSNVDSDEVLYYCNDKFGSRKGIFEGSITLHPLGIPHGPQPGAVEAALGATKTDELAVMVDTFHPLKLTPQALQIEDPDYWKSWQTK
ncbi:MAG: homogentisate 1,2-dioxygenase [Fimbriimonadaceae bacterium]|nr:homogentisate 1,2-dioxygenase [Fimbriimonadaceae bacterium]